MIGVTRYLMDAVRHERRVEQRLHRVGIEIDGPDFSVSACCERGRAAVHERKRQYKPCAGRSFDWAQAIACFGV